MRPSRGRLQGHRSIRGSEERGPPVLAAAADGPGPPVRGKDILGNDKPMASGERENALTGGRPGGWGPRSTEAPSRHLPRTGREGARRPVDVRCPILDEALRARIETGRGLLSSTCPVTRCPWPARPPWASPGPAETTPPGWWRSLPLGRAFPGPSPAVPARRGASLHRCTHPPGLHCDAMDCSATMPRCNDANQARAPPSPTRASTPARRLGVAAARRCIVAVQSIAVQSNALQRCNDATTPFEDIRAPLPPPDASRRLLPKGADAGGRGPQRLGLRSGALVASCSSVATPAVATDQEPASPRRR
jgi:hypothetical protein